MATSVMTHRKIDDPRKLRGLIDRAAELARSHAVRWVVVGLAAEEGDLCFPDFADFLQSSLRVEDGIFRMTRERAVLALADVDREAAGEILDRLRADFADEYPSLHTPEFETRMLEVSPDEVEALTVKAVLKAVFASEPSATVH